LDRYRARTGLPIANYFSAAKLLHLLRTVPGLRDAAERGEALFGTVDSWLLFCLSAGREHATDVSNASRTNLMNLAELRWDGAVLADLHIPLAMLPHIRPSVGRFGVFLHSPLLRLDEGEGLWGSLGLLERVPIAGVLGDQQAALFGQTCFGPGEVKCTYGTGAFLLMNTGTSIVSSREGLLSTVAYQLPQSPCVYALEGSVAYCGSVLQWLRDGLGLLRSAGDSEAVAGQVSDSAGLVLVPAFAGLHAPHWRSDARGVLVGLTAFHTRAHLVRAALEAAAFQTYEVAQAMQRDCHLRMSQLRVDGGMSANSLVMQFQSDLLGVPLGLPHTAETTALGVGMAAGLGVGLWAGLEELRGLVHIRRSWQPAMRDSTRRALVANWRRAVQRSLHLHPAASELDSDEALAAKEAAMSMSAAAEDARPPASFSVPGPMYVAGGFLAGLAAAFLLGLLRGRSP